MFLGKSAKKQALLSILSGTGINPSEAAFMGDDLIDLPAMAPANAVKEVKAAAQFVTNKVAWVRFEKRQSIFLP